MRRKRRVVEKIPEPEELDDCELAPPPSILQQMADEALYGFIEEDNQLEPPFFWARDLRRTR